MRARRAVGSLAALAALTALALLLVACEADEPDEPFDEPPAPAEPEPDEDDDEPEDAGDEPDEAAEDEPDEPDEAEEPQGPGAYAVSAGHPAAVDAGMQVLEAGGSAVDGAIAAAVAVSVVEPFASGIGGGGQTLVAAPGEDPLAYDYREVVPDDGQVPAVGTGVPGFVAGMERLHDEHGEAEWADLLAPAIDLAEGAETSGLMHEQLVAAAGRLPVGDLPHLYPGGQALAPGAPLEQPELAETLRRLADGGAEVFYEGAMAEELGAAATGVDAGSLASYEVQRSEPPRGEFGGYEVVGAAPPLPGSTLVQQLQIVEAAGGAEAAPGSADAIHATAMGWRAARAHISSDLGDPAFVDVPTDVHTDAERNAAIAADIPPDGLLPVDPGQPRGGTDPNTTHVTVVDADGQTVSMTNTLTNFWGSGQYALGFFLNDQLARFSIGQGGANVPEAGRRSVSWSLPAMVLDGEGRPVLGIGTPGGERIPNVLTQVLTRWALHGQPLEEAVAAPRYHLEGSALQVEQQLGGEVTGELQARGYTGVEVRPALYFGSVQALEVDYDAGEVSGARDDRREADWRADRP